jgi:hypothetical protein
MSGQDRKSGSKTTPMVVVAAAAVMVAVAVA